MRSSGQHAAAASHVERVLERDDAGEADEGADGERPRGFVGTAGEAVEDHPLGHALGGEDVERVVPGVAGVDDERQRPLVGDGDLRRERVPLHVAGRVVVVVVEAALADGDRSWTVGSWSKRSSMVSTPWRASCGCSPTVAWTAGWRRAQSIAASDVGRSHPTVIIVPTPAASAAATAASDPPGIRSS